ncbi:unnamed protein product [Coccothraustes coccothraustes]
MGAGQLPGAPDAGGSKQRGPEAGKKRGIEAEGRQTAARRHGALTSPALRAARRTRRGRAAHSHWLPARPFPRSHWPSGRASLLPVLLLAQSPRSVACRFPPPRENNFIEALGEGRGPKGGAAAYEDRGFESASLLLARNQRNKS